MDILAKIYEEPISESKQELQCWPKYTDETRAIPSTNMKLEARLLPWSEVEWQSETELNHVIVAGLL